MTGQGGTTTRKDGYVVGEAFRKGKKVEENKYKNKNKLKN